jgi:hypothetical protein
MLLWPAEVSFVLRIESVQTRAYRKSENVKDPEVGVHGPQGDFWVLGHLYGLAVTQELAKLSVSDERAVASENNRCVSNAY